MLSPSNARLRSLTIGLVTLAGAQAHAIIGGTADTTGSVYQYMGTLSNGFSGSPIAPNWFVTAAHTSPAVGQTYTNPDGSFTVTNVVIVPNSASDPNGLSGNTDIALVQVGGTFAHYYSYGSVPTSTAAGANGTTATFVGIGDYSPAIGTAPNGRMRATASNTVDALTRASLQGIPGNFAAYVYDLDNNDPSHNLLGSQVPIAGEGGIANADSGSGWFVNGGGSLPMLIAVSSGVESQFDATGTGSANYWDAGGIGIGASLGYYGSFIAQTTGVAPVAFAPVPEPAPCAALGFGIVALLRRRRRA